MSPPTAVIIRSSSSPRRRSKATKLAVTPLWLLRYRWASARAGRLTHLGAFRRMYDAARPSIRKLVIAEYVGELRAALGR